MCGKARSAPTRTKEKGGTSQVSVVDDDGNAFSMTTSIEYAFGARTMVRGFLLNNQLTDFSFLPVDDEGRPVANRVEGGKRPRSSMDPTIVFGKDGGLAYVLGSARRRRHHPLQPQGHHRSDRLAPRPRRRPPRWSISAAPRTRS